MDLRRLTLLSALARLGSMRAVADELGYTTSTVSQQLGVLSREAGATLLEREGRRVRLTPAGRRLAERAGEILAAVEAARAELDPEATAGGTVAVAGFATAVRRSLVPLVQRLARESPDVRLRVHEHEPAEALALLTADEVDLALLYDYDLAPTSWPGGLERVPLWSARWSLGVPAGSRDRGDAPAVFRAYAQSGWIVNSRNTADEHVVRLIASLAGFEPHIAHHADSLELVEDLIAARLGVGLLPADQPVGPAVRLLPLRRPAVTLRSYAVTRRGRESWPPLALVLRLLTEPGAAPAAGG